MYSLVSQIPAGDKKLRAMKAPLNPNAAEFVPMALRSSSTSAISPGSSSKFVTPAASSYGKAILDRSESSVSNKSDDEALQYQLPDDITPDFNITGTDYLPLASLSMNDVSHGSRFASPGFISKDQGLSSRQVNGNQYGEKLKHSVSSFGEYPSFPISQASVGKPLDRQIIGNGYQLARNHQSYTEGNSFSMGMSNELLFEKNAAASPIEFLASRFPEFAIESVAEVYFANGGDINLAMDMLTQLELQIDGGMNQNLEPTAFSAPKLTAFDFAAISGADGRNGKAKFASDDYHLNTSPHLSSGKESTAFFGSNSSIPQRGATDFASAVRIRDSGIWKHGRHGSSLDSDIGSRNFASSYDGDRRLPNRKPSHAAPFWPETGAAVANMYSHMREEARDHASVRDAYLEQARQAYFIGNKALAKELSIKGQLHNMHMKAAHGKAQESIYFQRNQEMLSNGQERMIDLHGLHVSEAIHVLKRELALMRNAAKVTGQRLHVDICVGTGHHTAMLSAAVQSYLLEEEGLDFSEPHPGLLRVVMH